LLCACACIDTLRTASLAHPHGRLNFSPALLAGLFCSLANLQQVSRGLIFTADRCGSAARRHERRNGWVAAQGATSLAIRRAAQKRLMLQMAIRASLRSTDVLLSAVLTQSVKHGRQRVEFVCGHCAGRSLRIVAVAEKNVRVECLSCGKESMIERDAASRPAAKPPTQSQ
jgi:hypothetical protein